MSRVTSGGAARLAAPVPRMASVDGSRSAFITMGLFGPLRRRDGVERVLRLRGGAHPLNDAALIRGDARPVIGIPERPGWFCIGVVWGTSRQAGAASPGSGGGRISARPIFPLAECERPG